MVRPGAVRKYSFGRDFYPDLQGKNPLLRFEWRRSEASEVKTQPVGEWLMTTSLSEFPPPINDRLGIC